jgi:hypothetical protein
MGMLACARAASGHAAAGKRDEFPPLHSIELHSDPRQQEQYQDIAWGRISQEVPGLIAVAGAVHSLASLARSRRGGFQTRPASAHTAREIFSGSYAHRAGLCAM